MDSRDSRRHGRLWDERRRCSDTAVLPVPLRKEARAAYTGGTGSKSSSKFQRNLQNQPQLAIKSYESSGVALTAGTSVEKKNGENKTKKRTSMFRHRSCTTANITKTLQDKKTRRPTDEPMERNQQHCGIAASRQQTARNNFYEKLPTDRQTDRSIKRPTEKKRRTSSRPSVADHTTALSVRLTLT